MKVAKIRILTSWNEQNLKFRYSGIENLQSGFGHHSIDWEKRPNYSPAISSNQVLNWAGTSLSRMLIWWTKDSFPNHKSRDCISPRKWSVAAKSENLTLEGYNFPRFKALYHFLWMDKHQRNDHQLHDLKIWIIWCVKWEIISRPINPRVGWLMPKKYRQFFFHSGA